MDFSSLNSRLLIRDIKSGDRVGCEDVSSGEYSLDLNLSSKTSLAEVSIASFIGYIEIYHPYDMSKEVDTDFVQLFLKWFELQAPVIGQIGILGEGLFEHRELINLLRGITENCRKTGRRIPLFITTDPALAPTIMPEFMEELLPQMVSVFEVEFYFMLESVGKRIEFLRGNISWENCKKNIDTLFQLKLPHFNVGFQVVITAFNMTTQLELLQFAKSLQDKHSRFILLKCIPMLRPEFHHPAVLKPGYMEFLRTSLVFLKEMKGKVHKSWSEYADYLEKLSNQLMSGESTWSESSLLNARRAFYTFLVQYQFKKNLSFLKVFPEYISFYKECQKISGETKLERAKS